VGQTQGSPGGGGVGQTQGSPGEALMKDDF